MFDSVGSACKNKTMSKAEAAPVLGVCSGRPWECLYDACLHADSAVVQGKDEDVLRARVFQLVHCRCHPLALDHRADRDPALLIQRADCRRSSSRSDLETLCQGLALDVVRDVDVSLRGEDTGDAGFDERDERGERGRERGVRRARGDQDRLGREQRVDGVEARGAHRVPRLDQVDDAVGHAQGTGSLDTAPDVLDLRLLRPAGLLVHLAEELAGEHLEARRDPSARQRLDRLQRARDGHLDLKRALAEAEREELGDLLGVGRFRYDVLAGDAECDGAEGDEARNIGGREEDAAISGLAEANL